MFYFYQIHDGKPLYVFTHVILGQQWELGVDRRVSDGHWHVLLLRRHGPNIILYLDERVIKNVTHVLISQTSFTVKTMTLGLNPLEKSNDQGQDC